MLSRKRRFHDEYDKIKNMKKEYSKKRQTEVARRLAFDEGAGEELREIEKAECRLVELSRAENQ